MLERPLQALRFVLVRRDESVDFLWILRVVADGGPDLVDRHADALGERADQLFATLRSAACSGDHLPDIRPPGHDGAASRRTIAEDDSGMTVQPHAFPDVPLG